ncbi:hypothetical protein D3C77_525840 [compost metagenome]
MNQISEITSAFFMNIETILSAAEEQSTTSDSVNDVAVNLKSMVTELGSIVNSIQASLAENAK